MNSLPWRFSNLGIFGIWQDYKSYPMLLFTSVSNFIFFSKIANTMCCRNHKMWRNNWSTTKSPKRMWWSIIIHVMKGYHKGPLFVWGRKSLNIYHSKDTLPKDLPKSMIGLPFIILLSIAMIEWRPKQKRKTIWYIITSLKNPISFWFQISMKYALCSRLIHIANKSEHVFGHSPLMHIIY